MKKKGLTITFLVVGFVIVLVMLLLIFIWLNQSKVDGNQVLDGTVQVRERVSDNEESSYWVDAVLPGTDFSSIGQVLAEMIAQEWDTYDGMTKEQRLVSSNLWGMVGIQTNTWTESEEAIGFAVDNPLEALDWLDKTGYFGMENTDASTPTNHVQVLANTAQGIDRKLSKINVTAGYSKGRVQVTLSATLSANSETYTTGSACSGYATYEENSATTGSGLPVLIVTTNETNNTGYYNGDYFDPTAYWVKDNVFYTLRVFGDEIDKTEIQAVLDRILAEI